MSVAESLQRPDTRHLEHVLRRLLGAYATIAERSPNVCASSYPSETVSCHVGNGDVRLLCTRRMRPARAAVKYGPTGTITGHGHRGGVAYEGAEYRHVLGRGGHDEHAGPVGSPRRAR